MSQFCVNQNTDREGNHEVHNISKGCKTMPNLENQLGLGEFPSCHGAVEKAKKTFPKADGCANCCPDCHTE